MRGPLSREAGEGWPGWPAPSPAKRGRDGEGVYPVASATRGPPCYHPDMSLSALAVLRIPPTVVRDALPAAGDDADLRTAANGDALRIRALSDSTVIELGISLASEPDAIAARLKALLGDLLDVHDAERVPVYPSSHTLAAGTWNDVVDELGEAADWIPVRAAAVDPFGGLMGGFPGMGGGQAPDMAAMAAMFQGGDASALLEQAMQMAQQLADSGAFADFAKNMAAPAGNASTNPQDPRAALEQLGVSSAQLDAMGLDLDKLATDAKAMLEKNPELEQKLRGAFESAQAGASQSEPESEPEGGEDA